MKKLEFKFNITVFLVVDTKGNILYSSDDIKLMGLTNKDIYKIIKEKSFPCGYEVKVEEIGHKSEKFYIVEICCQDAKKFLYYDKLTNLYNRNLWEWFKKNDTKKDSTENSLVVIDIDNLKSINDNFGHSKGDRYIKLVAKSIRKCIRDNDLAFRFGGDEFIILLFGTKKRQAEKIVKRIKNTIKRDCKKNHLSISISAGISKFSTFDDLGEAFEKADKLMYQEKKNKKR